jgi:hypothetical protein
LGVLKDESLQQEATFTFVRIGKGGVLATKKERLLADGLHSAEAVYSEWSRFGGFYSFSQ